VLDGQRQVAADVAGGVLYLVRDAASADGAPVATYTLRAAPVRPYEPPPWG
jgi:hypothetical protein